MRMPIPTLGEGMNMNVIGMLVILFFGIKFDASDWHDPKLPIFALYFRSNDRNWAYMFLFCFIFPFLFINLFYSIFMMYLTSSSPFLFPFLMFGDRNRIMQLLSHFVCYSVSLEVTA